MASFLHSLSSFFSSFGADLAYLGLTLLALIVSGAFIAFCDQLMEVKK
jgi:hypothetical protein